MNQNQLAISLFDFVESINNGCDDNKVYTAMKHEIYAAYTECIINAEQRKDLEGQIKFLWVNRNRAKTLRDVMETIKFKLKRAS